MQMRLMSLIMPALAAVDISTFQAPANIEDLEFIKGSLKELSEGRKRPIEIADGKRQCSFKGGEESIDNKFMVFISFSVPDTYWIGISQEISRIGGVFLLRGLPNNSFEEFSQKVLSLRKKGLTAPIQINPILFQEFGIETVPTYVVSDEGRYDKLSGMVSVRYALESFIERGDLGLAEEFMRKLERKNG